MAENPDYVNANYVLVSRLALPLPDPFPRRLLSCEGVPGLMVLNCCCCLLSAGLQPATIVHYCPKPAQGHTPGLLEDDLRARSPRDHDALHHFRGQEGLFGAPMPVALNDRCT